MSEHPNVALTRRGYEAFARGDLAALSELIAEAGIVGDRFADEAIQPANAWTGDELSLRPVNPRAGG